MLALLTKTFKNSTLTRKMFCNEYIQQDNSHGQSFPLKLPLRKSKLPSSATVTNNKNRSSDKDHLPAILVTVHLVELMVDHSC